VDRHVVRLLADLDARVADRHPDACFVDAQDLLQTCVLTYARRARGSGN
jgi:hypothetical protein